MAIASYFSLLFSIFLVFYVRNELAAKIAKHHFNDYERSFYVFLPCEDAKCLCWMEHKQRRCSKDMSRDAKTFAPTLRRAILASLEHPMLQDMLNQYSQLCHCGIHRDDVSKESFETLAKRWEEEVKIPLTPPAGSSSPRRSPGRFTDESADEFSDRDVPPQIPGRLLNTPVSTPTPQTRGTGRSPRRRSCSPLSQQPMSAETELKQLSPFEPCGRHDRDPLHRTILKPVSDDDAGSIYIFTHPDHNGFVKIGYTMLKNGEARVRKWIANCGLSYKLTGTWPTPAAKRVEELIHADLWDVRFVFPCLDCDQKHNEWFQVSVERAEKVIRYWVNWMEQFDPYQETMLKPQCVQWMFHKSDLNLAESGAEEEQRMLFTSKSNNEPWIDHSSILAKGACSVNATPEEVKSGTSTTPGNASASANGEKIHIKSVTTTSKSQSQYLTPPPDRSRDELSPPDGSAGRGLRRRLFREGSNKQGPASSPTLSPTDTSVADPDDDSSEEARSTPSRPKPARKRGSGKRVSQRPSSVQATPRSIPSGSSTSIASAGNREYSGDACGGSPDRPAECLDASEAPTDAISPLQLPSPPVDQRDLSSVETFIRPKASVTRRQGKKKQRLESDAVDPDFVPYEIDSSSAESDCEREADSDLDSNSEPQNGTSEDEESSPCLNTRSKLRSRGENGKPGKAASPMSRRGDPKPRVSVSRSPRPQTESIKEAATDKGKVIIELISSDDSDDGGHGHQSPLGTPSGNRGVAAAIDCPKVRTSHVKRPSIATVTVVETPESPPTSTLPQRGPRAKRIPSRSNPISASG